jgi:hypothetical protein
MSPFAAAEGGGLNRDVLALSGAERERLDVLRRLMRGDRADVLGLKNRAIAGRAAIGGRIEQVAFGVDGQWALGIQDIVAVEVD